MRILFWGTPEFAVPSLRALTEEGHAVAAVVTQPDRPAGRGKALRASPVKRVAETLDIPVLQPERASAPEFVSDLASLELDVSVVVAYGQILSEAVLETPRIGTFNVHASLLPELRGAAPINWSIILGHSHSGVSIIRLVRELDAGPILEQVPVELSPDITAGELGTMLAELGALALINNLAQLELGSAPEKEQDHDRATYAPKLDRDDVRIDWSLSAEEIGRWLRGCDPKPGAWTRLGEDRVQLFGPEVSAAPGVEGMQPVSPGTVVGADAKSGLLVATGRGYLGVREVKAAGKPRMTTGAWISGRSVEAGQTFE